MSVAIVGCLTAKDKIEQHNIDKKRNQCLLKNEITRIPGFKGTYQTQADCDFPNKEKVSLALTVFYIRWYSAFGDPENLVLNNLNELYIEWSPVLMKFENGYDLDGNFISEGNASGLAFGKKHIQVYMQNGKQIYETSFVHELVHASIRAINHLHGDPDHEGTKYEGWTTKHTQLIKDVNEDLRFMMRLPNNDKKN